MNNHQITTLASLAILKVDLDEERTDYLGYLQQFILHLLNKKKPETINDDIICNLLLKEFGLKIPKRGVQLVLRRMQKKGFIEKEDSLYKSGNKLPYVDLNEKKSNAIRSIESVYLNLRQFVKKEFSLDWTEEHTSNVLIEFLSKFGVDFLRAYIFNTALPELKKSEPYNLFIISRYICHLRDCCSPIFDNIAVLVKGHMYANALLCPDLESIQKKFNKVKFFLDTGLILSLLGIQGIQLKSLSEELLFLIKKLNGSTAIFFHTFEEINNILSFTEMNYDNTNITNKILSEIRKNKIPKSDLTLLKGKLDDRIKELGIEIFQTPEYDKRYQISEEELQKAVEGMIHYKNPKALEFDINSVRSIYVLRKDSVPLRLEDATAVFVTTNDILARAAYIVGLNHNSSKEVSSVITDYSLANVAWLKAPLGSPDLPIKEMLATCYAAMEPNNSLWTKYIEEIDNLVKLNQLNPDEHAILRASDVAITELMNLTLGDEDSFTGGSIKTILERVKLSLISEKEIELCEEKNISRIAARERDEALLKNETAQKKLYWQIKKLANIISFLIIFLIIITLIIFTILSQFLITPFIANSKILTAIVSCCLVIGVIWTLMNWIFGITIKSLKEKIEETIHVKIYNKLLKTLFP